MSSHHFLVVCFPVHGHINPSLELAHRLTSLGHHVTFVTTIAASRRLSKPPQRSLSFATFSDGFDEEGPQPNRRSIQYFSDIKHYASEFLTNLLTSNNEQAPRPFTFMIYSLLCHWAADVAAAFHIPSALLFVQPATLLALYYYYFHGYADTIPNQELPGLPLLTANDMPSFLSPTSPHAFILPLLKEQIEFLDQKSQSKVLVNSFDALEIHALEAIHSLKMIPIGPLIPFGELDGKNRSDPSFVSEDYIEWLNSKPKSSVVYISFGSVYVLPSKQKEEIAHALLNSGYMFLWVMIGEEKQEEDEEKLKELQGQGRIVRWCCQIEALNHPSVGCFMSHCGWNSTIECLASGLPMVAFPQQVDQATNAKLVEDMWKTGVRVKANSEGIVEREEIRQCLDLVMGSRDNGRRQEMVENARDWKRLATRAVAEDGTSCLNLKAFVAEIDHSG